ncbi:MAG: 4-phosphoerythronate dehydrogenase [Bacteroidales bacterium]|nr:4-phosphoerythronate dehydrogenase [Bacteroidales bacterium]
MATDPLKVIIEQNVPFMGVLQPYAQVEFMPARLITPETVADADAIVVRTRTRCDAALLAGSKVKFVGTATIGTDHIDLDWCAANGITVANAPGCNAPAVAQYVFSSIIRLVNRQLRQHTIGIVGVGHVGRIVEQWARALEMPVMLCDPPRQRAEGGDQWSTLDDIARRADIITFHTPLTREGNHATWHLADADFFGRLRRGPIIINAARGPVTDTAAWIDAIDSGITGPAVVDCWEDEPRISLDLLERAAIGTPHIAGYSLQGKIRASQMVLTALCRQFGLPELRVAEPAPAPTARSITPSMAWRSYDPMADSEALRNAPAAFEQLRNSYNLRNEPAERWSH